ncbi:AAA family ATPase, partial [Patulibacter sp. NPDC049589]|uniref:ATP-binding protein n=1 Tax=Patulibacter sp. NPDC049589 TaxID=3154731 RepID=UPI0034423049
AAICVAEVSSSAVNGSVTIRVSYAAAHVTSAAHASSAGDVSPDAGVSPPPGSAPSTASRPAPSGSGGLPTPLTSFVGREAEVDRLDALLDRERLVTLVGPGGAGKTRLADETATRRQARIASGPAAAAPRPAGPDAGDPATTVLAAVDGSGPATTTAQAAARPPAPPLIRRVELAPMTEGHEIEAALLDVFALREATRLRTTTGARAPGAMNRLLDGLAGLDALLLLDNCEHLIADAADIAETLLRGCPGLRILATSREPLAIGGEHVVALDPLGLPDGETPEPAAALGEPAVRLFADRAAAASSGFVVDAETVGPVVEICRRLDGMPLALELAAARLRTMPLRELASRLDDRFRLLTTGPRTAEARQRTLRGVVDWSWELLSDPERRLARRLAVLPGGATPAAAEAVCSGDGVPREDVLDLLAALVDKSVIQVRPDRGEDGHGARYRMLETLREYGLQQLERAGETTALRRAHAEWFAGVTERGDAAMRTADQVPWLRRLRAERENLLAAIRCFADERDARAALRMVASLTLFWVASGNPGELIEAGRIALEVPGDADPVDRVLVEGVEGFARMFGDDETGPLDEASQAALLERIAATEAPDRPVWVAVRPMFAYALGDLKLVHRVQEDALAHDDPWVRATANLLAGQLAENEGDLETTLRCSEEALRGFRAIGERWGTSAALSSMAVPLLHAGELDRAEAAILEAQAAEQDLGGEESGPGPYVLAEIRLRQGRIDDAREIARRAAEGWAGERELAFGRLSMGRIARLAGDREDAWRWATEALRHLDARPRAGIGHERAMVLTTIAGLELDDGRLPEAVARLVDGYQAARGTRDMPIVAMVGVVIAAARLAHGEPERAAETLGAAATLRGADDLLSPETAGIVTGLRAALGDDFDRAYARGRGLDREAALERIDPASLATPG